MKRVLVTGGAGFVGRHMIRELQQREDIRQIVSIDLKPATVDADFRKPPHVHLIQDMHGLLRQEAGTYDLIVHCAFHVGGRTAIDGVNMNLAANVQLDAKLFEWATRQDKKPAILYFSSSAAYPKYLQSRRMVRHRQVDEKTWQEQMRLTEDDIDLTDLHEPDADYGWAKLCGERLAHRARAMGVPVFIVRPFSGYGEDQEPKEYPFPAIVRRVAQGDTTVWGPVGQSRDWIHISDVVQGALAVVDAGYQEPVNLCTGIATEMGDLAQMVIDELKERGHPYFGPVQYDESKPTGVFYRVGDPTVMHRFYTPQVTLEEGIRRALNVIPS